MATLWISEYKWIGRTDRDSAVAQLAQEPSLRTQKVTYTSSTQSTALGAGTKFIRVIADADVYLEFGANPTATANSLYLPSGQVEYFAVDEGNEVAAYDGTT